MTPEERKVMELALEALDQLTNAADTFSVSGVYFNEGVWAKKCLSDAYFAITTIEQALAQPAVAEQHKQSTPCGEPVAWKPIETAPKDVMVLVCLPRQMNLVVRAWYNSIHNFWQTDYEGEGGITRPIYFHEGDLWHPIPPIYTTPPQRKPWVSLSDEDIERIAKKARSKDHAITLAMRELKEKNT